jgi:ATP-dependent DNA ligase
MRSCYAFDPLEMDGADLRPMPLGERRAELARLLERNPPARTRDNAGRQPEIEKLVIRLEIRGNFRNRNSCRD